MPDASGRIRPVSIPRVPWHDVELRTVRKGPVITDWYGEPPANEKPRYGTRSANRYNEMFRREIADASRELDEEAEDAR